MNDLAMVARLRAMIGDAERAVVFTGAGISTDSGIPDFRSPGGIWTKYAPIDFRDFMASEDMRRESWRRKFAMDSVMKRAEPNRGHRAVAQLVRESKVSAVITQNVDGLHQASGVPDEQVIELHGNGTYAACLNCSTRYELAPIKTAFQDDEQLPECTWCGGIVKTATISFGQAMPQDEMERAQQQVLACDLLLSMGSSLVVYPAAGFPGLAKQNGAKLVIINREPTDLDQAADLVLHMSISDALGGAVGTN